MVYVTNIAVKNSIFIFFYFVVGSVLGGLDRDPLRPRDPVEGRIAGQETSIQGPLLALGRCVHDLSHGYVTGLWSLWESFGVSLGVPTLVESCAAKAPRRPSEERVLSLSPWTDGPEQREKRSRWSFQSRLRLRVIVVDVSWAVAVCVRDAKTIPELSDKVEDRGARAKTCQYRNRLNIRRWTHADRAEGSPDARPGHRTDGDVSVVPQSESSTDTAVNVYGCGRFLFHETVID